MFAGYDTAVGERGMKLSGGEYESPVPETTTSRRETVKLKQESCWANLKRVEFEGYPRDIPDIS